MRRQTTIGICVLLALLAAAGAWYAHDRRGGAMLRQAEALMNAHPDSARQVLEQYAPARHLRGEHQARYALLLTQARFKTYQPTDNDSLIRIAVDYYSHSADSLRKAWSCFYAGRTYANRQEKSRALRCYQQAASAATKTSDYKFQSLLYFYWGSILQSQYPHTEGLDKFEESLRFDWLRKDTLGAVATLEEIAWSHAYNTDFNQSVDCLQKALSYTNANDTSTLEDLYQRFGIILHLGGRYNEALRYIDLSLQYTSADPRFQTTKLFTKGIILNSLGQYDSVSYYISQRKWENHYDRANYQREMARLKNGQGKYAEAYQWMSQYSESKDSIYHHENQYSLVQLQKLYDYSQMQRESLRLKAEKQQWHISLLSMSLAIISLILFGIFASFAHKKAIDSLHKRLERKEIQLTIQEKEASNLKATVKRNEATIVEKENNLNALIQEEIRLHKKITDAQEELEMYKEHQSHLRKMVLAKSELYMRLQSLKTMSALAKDEHGDSLKLSAEETKELIKLSNTCFGDFTYRLSTNYPSLNKDDIIICCLIKLEVRSCDMEYILSCTHDALAKRKYRIKKEKIGICPESESLDDFIRKY